MGGWVRTILGILETHEGLHFFTPISRFFCLLVCLSVRLSQLAYKEVWRVSTLYLNLNNENNLKNEDNLEYEDKHKNEDNLKN